MNSQVSNQDIIGQSKIELPPQQNQQFQQSSHNQLDNNNNQQQQQQSHQTTNQNSLNNISDPQTIQKNLDDVYEDRDKMNNNYIELLEREQNLRFQLWRQQMDQIKDFQSQNKNPDNSYNKNMGMIAYLTNNTLPIVQNPMNQYFATPGGGGSVPPNYSNNFPNNTQTPLQMRTQMMSHNRNASQSQSPNFNQGQNPQQMAQVEAMMRDVKEKEEEIMQLKHEMAQEKLRYEEAFQRHNQQQSEKFQQQLRLAEEENIKVKRQMEIELEGKKREIESGRQLYEELALRHKVAIEQKDKEMNEFIQYKYKPLEEKVEVLKEENIISENKVNVNKQGEKQVQENEIKKMQIFIMSQKQELDNLRKTANEYDQLRRTGHLPVHISAHPGGAGGNVLQENQTHLLEKIDNLNQLLDIERQKNRELKDNQQNIDTVNRKLFQTPYSGQDNQDLQEQINELKRANDGLRLLVGEHRPNFIKRKVLKQQQSNNLQVDVDKQLVQSKKSNQQQDLDDSHLSIHSASIQNGQFQKASQFPDGEVIEQDEIDQPECLKQNNTLRQYLTDLLKRNEELQNQIQNDIQQGNYQQGGGDGNQNNEITRILQEKLELMKNKYQDLQIDNRKLKEAVELQIKNEGLLKSNQLNISQQSLNDSYQNINNKNFRVENQKLKAYLQLKINEGEEFKVKALRFDSLQEENQMLLTEIQKLRIAVNSQGASANQSQNQQQYNAVLQVRDMDMRVQIMQQELQKVTNALREKMQENEMIKAQNLNIQKHAKENIFNMERSYRDNQSRVEVIEKSFRDNHIKMEQTYKDQFMNMEKNYRDQYLKMEQSFKDNQQRQILVNRELDKVTDVLRGKMKESDELKAAIAQFDNLMKEKNMQNEQLAKKCQQLAQVLQEKSQQEQRVGQVFQQNQQMKQDMEKLTNALKEKLRENDLIKNNFKKLEAYIREREIIEGELRKMKDILEQKLRETGEWKTRCQQMEGRLRQGQELEGKLRDVQGKMRFILNEIASIPNKIGPISNSNMY